MFTDVYRCRSCGHEFEISLMSFRVGPLPVCPDPAKDEESTRRHTRQFCCNACVMEVTIPVLLIRPDWFSWKQNAGAVYSRYPFLRDLITRIEFTYAGLPWHVDICDISCPYCAGKLVMGKFQPSCKSCGSSDLEHINCYHAQVAGAWPPLA